ncbi:MAG: GAF domain-containing protein [Deltaproteobacteria bacterium]|nr:GAF domain-containing protein [Deltaproteobacteria bacterium]
MAVFEVFIPAREADAPNVTLTVEGRNWIEALRSGLKSIGEGGEAIANVMCDVKDDGSIHVTDVATRRVFRLREQKGAGGAATPPAAAPASPPASPSGPGSDDVMGSSPKTMLQFKALQRDGVAQGQAPAAAVEETERLPVPPATTRPATATNPPVTAMPGASLPDLDQSVPWTTMPGPASKPTGALAAAALSPSPSKPAMPAAQPEPAPPSTATAPAAPTPAARTPTPGPFSRATPAQGIPAPRQPTGPVKPVTPQVMDGDTAKIPTYRASAEQTERVERTRRGPAPPTPRGVPAPAPRRPSGQFAQAPQPQAREESKPQPTDPKIGRVAPQSVDVTDAIAAVFDATQDLYLEPRLTPEKVAATMLDIALAHVPAESGSFYLADVNGYELSFAAVRGPKADLLKRSGMTVPLGQGIIGFCALEGICLSVSDIQNDPRWLSSIGKKLDYLPKDTLCASAEKDGRLFGAVQLINSKQGFDAAHMEVLRFIGLTAAALLERIESSS